MSWNATAGNQLVSGSVLRNGATASGLYSITTTIPSSLDSRIMSKANVETYTTASTSAGNISNLPSNGLPTKGEIIFSILNTF